MPGHKVGEREAYFGGDWQPRRRRAVACLLATATLLAVGARGANPALAGTYMMWNCNVPGHANSPMYPWQLADDVPTGVTVVDACAAGGGISFALDASKQMGFNRGNRIMLMKPSGPRSQIKFVKVRLWYAARLAGSGHPITFRSTYYLPDYSAHPGLANLPPGSENLVADQQLDPDTWYYTLGVGCGPLDGNTQNPGPCNADNQVPLLVRGTEVTLREDVLPTVLKPGGNLLDGGQQSGVRTLTYSASDPQSGLSMVDVLLDETVVGSQDLTLRCAYSDFTVCPAASDETLQIDTRAVPNGSHRLRVRARDAAGNERVVDGGAVEVSNESKPGSIGAFALVAKFNGTSRGTLTVPFGRRVVLRGRISQGGQPIGAGASVEVLERLDRKGARERVASRIETEADGSCTVVVPTDRPSRAVRLAYRAADGSQVVSRTFRVRVRAASQLRASLRGRIVRFSGRVLSGPIAKRGKRVLMEGRSPGSAWTQFKSLRTDRRGGFSGSYRLRVRRPGVMLKIRAVVPSEPGYGYVSSRSRAVTLRVR
jgi:hypothetical protein